MQEYNKFENKISVFITLLKQATKMHSDHIFTLGKQQQELWNSQKELNAENSITSKTSVDTKQWEGFLEQCAIFTKQIKVAKNSFQELIKLSNVELGALSNMWGSYIEQLAVLHFINVLRAELNVDTYMQKLKRHWGKNKNVEVDIFALNKDTAFLIEVKNQLKPEHVNQIVTTREKIEEFFPELKSFKLQSIIMCINFDESIVDDYIKNNIWIIQYAETIENSKTPNWVWRFKKD